jgi:predicted GNAT family acetyltransferase
MGWCTTANLDEFLAAANGYLTSKAAENTPLLSAAQDFRGTDPLFGWWEPSEGTQPRGAFLHVPPAPLLIAGGAPETAAALAAPLARAGRYVCGVDAPAEAADAFAAAWSQRAGVGVKVHRQSRVYRLTGLVSDYPGPPGRPRTVTAADRELLVAWLRSFRSEIGQFTGAPEATADDLLGYGGATFWETGEGPVAMAAVSRPVARIVRISIVYTPPQSRRHGYAAAVMLAVTRAVLAGQAREVVMITDGTRPLRHASRMGYELIGERAMLSFGPPTGALPRMPTGPLPRFRG